MILLSENKEAAKWYERWESYFKGAETFILHCERSWKIISL